MYQKNSNDEYVIVFLRGDYEVNETKLTNYLGEKKSILRKSRRKAALPPDLPALISSKLTVR